MYYEPTTKEKGIEIIKEAVAYVINKRIALLKNK
jgi:hypothetical protein